VTISVVPTSRESRRLTGTVESPRRSAPREDTPPRVWPVWALKLRQDYEAKLAAAERRIAELEMSIMETEKANRVSENTTTALARYGESDDVKGLTARLQTMLPNANEIGLTGVALVAQVAILHGLDPLPGADHLYAWKQRDRRTGQEKVVVTIGYKGLLHLARKQVRFTYQSRPMTDDERAEHGLQDGAVGYVTTLHLIADALECKQAGIPYHPIIGTATWKPGEEVPRGRTAAWVAKKNSLKDALRQVVTTGTRLQEAIDSALQLDRGEYTGEDWSLEIGEQNEQVLIESGLVPPDDDGEGDEGAAFSGQIIDVQPDSGDTAMSHEGKPGLATDGVAAGQPAMCALCGLEPADPTTPFPTFCATCAEDERKRREIQEAATEQRLLARKSK